MTHGEGFDKRGGNTIEVFEEAARYNEEYYWIFEILLSGIDIESLRIYNKHCQNRNFTGCKISAEELIFLCDIGRYVDNTLTYKSKLDIAIGRLDSFIRKCKHSRSTIFAENLISTLTNHRNFLFLPTMSPTHYMSTFGNLRGGNWAPREG